MKGLLVPVVRPGPKRLPSMSRPPRTRASASRMEMAVAPPSECPNIAVCVVLRPVCGRLVFEQSFQTQQKGTQSSKEQQAEIVLLIQYMTGCILASAGAFNNETVFDSFESNFSEIVALASRLVPDTSESLLDWKPLNAAFDIGVLAPLYFVASRCRYPSIRRHALDLLRKGPTQEGIWNREMLSSVAERIMQMEEVDCVGISRSTDVPAIARIRVLNATINSAERAVALHCCRQQFGDSGEPHVLHERVRY
jgi:hypothetical protein